MKIIQVSLQMPYKENLRATSALPYHLMVRRDKDIDIEIYSFNCNNASAEQIRQVEQELGVTIHTMPLPRWFRWMFRFHLLFLRLLLSYPLHNYLKLPQRLVDEITAKQPDGVWIYGEELTRVARQLSAFRRIHTLPDSEALYYHRMLGRPFVVNSASRYWRCAFMYPKYRRMEREMDDAPTIAYHLVGDADAAFLRDINPKARAMFLRHPHYEVTRPVDQAIHFATPKIRLLVAGQYNYYMQHDADQMVAALAHEAATLTDGFELTFLGKGWEHHADTLRKAGWTVTHITFAPDYTQEVCRHDIQLTPISIGTGTKGKVLDALANGLMVVGSWWALENIAVVDGESCLQYRSPQDVPQLLRTVLADPARYERMAEAGRQAILTQHDRAKVAREMFGCLCSPTP